MRFHWLVPSCLGLLGTVLLSLPAEAARLQFWRFDASENRLIFTTDSSVQPRAQLISDPTRIVIDLPGTTLGRPSITQAVGGTIREVRVGQFDSQTTRLVIELNPGYTVDPQQVLVRGENPTQWSVQLPPPQRVQQPPVAASPAPTPSSPAPETAAPPAAIPDAATQLENVRITPDGFFVRISGAEPRLTIERSRDRRQLNIDLQNTALSTQITERDIAVGRYGVNRLQLSQVETSPPVARITLDLAEDSPNWQATVSNLGGVVIVPTGGIAATSIASTEPDDTPAESPTEEPAVIQAVELAEDGQQLLIQSDRPVPFTSGWDRVTTAYQITLSGARLAEQVTGPQLGTGSPLLRVSIRQEDEQTVVILAQPAAGVRIGGVEQIDGEVVALQLQGQSQTAVAPPQQQPPQQNIPVPAPTSPALPPPSTSPPISLPDAPNSRVVVVIDPGHGGPDPGAVGINGLREKDVILPISLQVATLLEQQGIQVIMTRDTDRDLDLEPRVQIAERANADLFVSIHANAISLSRPDVNGLETYYYSNSGLRLAQVIHSSMVQGTGSIDRGVRQARFYVLRNTSMPAVLLETGFVTGRDDAARLADPAFREQMAGAIARGILQYVQQNF